MQVVCGEHDMSRPSEPLLAWLRKMSEDRGLNTAALASRTDLPRARMRKILLKISDALELSPADMGMPIDEEAMEAQGPSGPRLADPPNVATTPSTSISPWDSHHRQLFEVAFALGCDFGFTVDTSQLDHSGVPSAVLDAHEGQMMLIQLDAAFHKYNNPRYDPEGVVLTLSFDTLHECTFPWSAIRQVIYTPLIHEPDEDGEGDDHPHLRLIT